MSKQQDLEKIYKHTHKDFKGVINGKKSILMNVNGAASIVFLSELTDEQIAEKLKIINKPKLTW
jgi:hypothetical protein